MHPSDRYTADDVTTWLTTKEVAKGRGYLDRISELEVGEDEITARVQGTEDKPYRVRVKLSPEAHDFPLKAQCSCPVGAYCKHVAATLLAAIDAREQTETVRPAALGWMEALRQLASAPPRPTVKAKLTAQLFWLVDQAADERDVRIACFKATTEGDGRPRGRLTAWTNFEQALTRPFHFVDDQDVAIIRLLLAQSGRHPPHPIDFSLIGRHGAEILQKLLASGRFYADGHHMAPLCDGPPRRARIRWRQDALGQFRAEATAEPAEIWVLPFNPPGYIDGEAGEVGRLDFDAPPSVIARILAAPPLNEAEARLATTVLAEAAPGVPPPEVVPARVIDAPMTPRLTIGTLEATLHGLRNHPPQRWTTLLDVVEPTFGYLDELGFRADDPRRMVTLPDGEEVMVRRHHEEEARRLEELRAVGLAPIPRGAVTVYPAEDLSYLWTLDSEAAWAGFMSEALPVLRERGWKVEVPENFRHHFVEVEEWTAEIGENEGGWFDLDMGILVEGKRLALAPLLSELFRSDGRWLDAGKLSRIPDQERVDLISPLGQRIRVRAERIKPLAQTLIDLFDTLPKVATSGTEGIGKLRISRLDAPRLAHVAMPGWRIDGMQAIDHMARKIAGLASVGPVEPPAGFALSLRPYQKEGLAWLQYLREHELAGILADDMGLGKTAQTLAHLLLEKEAGRLGGSHGPALIVLPTSLIFNWKAEAARFAPALSVLSLQGKARKDRFADIPHHDLVLTTYPLLWRDAKELALHDYHSLILDEAQTVKNASSKGAAVVRQIKAKHRLCLTGTPLENHLGELWSQFDFLLPGFLGDAKSFTKTWRTPIEKYRNALRSDLLSRRIRPFILRRRKEDVATELPPKTIIPRTVELEGGQRDLYEIVRSAMDKRIRDEIASRGFARSQIVILDALLKLRQVCCDPRLVKSESAKKVKERAKLDQLMGMLPELVDEGRKVLVFSQFTSMLALIEDELKTAGLPYALLTGDTHDREAQIDRFQNGDVPIFLISLKAGGIGLNLTAADTVIHYDPWWNPAMENQATDRAHRLGQTKPVFVYKLIVGGSIEEKIVTLQEQKAALAESILSADGVGDVKFSEADIQALLAPLPPTK